MLQREFELPRGDRMVTGVLWTDEARSPGKPLVLFGHGASGDRHQSPIPYVARSWSRIRILGAVDRRSRARQTSRRRRRARRVRGGVATRCVRRRHARRLARRARCGSRSSRRRYRSGWVLGPVDGYDLRSAAGCRRAAYQRCGARFDGHHCSDRALSPTDLRCRRGDRVPGAVPDAAARTSCSRARNISICSTGWRPDDKRMHANPGLHPEVPVEELDYSAEFLTRYLAGEGKTKRKIGFSVSQ